MNVIVKLHIPPEVNQKDKRLAKKIHKHLVSEAKKLFKTAKFSGNSFEKAVPITTEQQFTFVRSHYNRHLISGKEYKQERNKLQKKFVKESRAKSRTKAKRIATRRRNARRSQR
jgi:hypothetical protein